MNVRTVGRLSTVPVLSEDIKELTLEKNPMSVKNVVRPLVDSVLFEYMKEYMLGQTYTMSVSSVGKPSFLAHLFKGT